MKKLSAGDVIDNYILEQLIAKGAYSEVFLARHKVLQVDVIIKIYDEDKIEIPNIFTREIRAIRLIDHPNIVRFYDAGLVSNRPYIITEYIKGLPLNQILEREDLSLQAVLEIALNIANALKFIHDQNILHLDLKPNNILIPFREGTFRFSQLKIVDFGTSTIMPSKRGEYETEKGGIYGTPFYMSPEQFSAETQFTTASDVYSLGVLLYEMIYGRRPFEANTLAEVIREKTSGKEIYFPKDIKIPRRLKDLLSRMLEFLVRRRANIDEVIEELHYLMDHSTPGVFKRFKKRPKIKNVGESSLEKLGCANLISYPLAKTGCLILSLILLASLSFFGYSAGDANAVFWGITAGIILIILGIIIGFVFRRWIKNRKTEIEENAQELLFGSKSREMLTETLAVQVDALISKINRIDDQILGTSLAIMVKEYEQAKETPHRHAALMNVVQLLEKLVSRLSPWYVRHEKLVALMVAMIGILSGAATITINIINVTKGK